jgi:hypothetical protein
VGLEVGCIVGLEDGCDEGLDVGCIEGMPEGWELGHEDGAEEGWTRDTMHKTKQIMEITSKHLFLEIIAISRSCFKLEIRFFCM